LTHAGTGNWFKRLPPEEQALMAQYKFGSKEAFSRRMATDLLGSIQDWVKILPELTHSDFSAAWFIKSRAAALLPNDQEKEAADREAFHDKALETTEAEVRTVITGLKHLLKRLPKSHRTPEMEWVLTEGLRRTYAPPPQRGSSHRRQVPAV
jgi:hypothetical protein